VEEVLRREYNQEITISEIIVEEGNYIPPTPRPRFSGSGPGANVRAVIGIMHGGR